MRGADAGVTGVRSRGHAPHGGRPHVLITGGAGFIGTNLARRLVERGERVTVLDNLSRVGVEENLRWLRATCGERLQPVLADVRESEPVRRAVRGARWVVHLAAQVAVTTSFEDPRHDFSVNASGTLNLLESLRELEDPPPLLFTSTNKVYGGLGDVPLEARGRRWEPRDAHDVGPGIGEDRPLDLHSPYACSKGCADLYVRDYARCYGLPTVVFRMSCIYGPHQHGNEDQGWVAHFLRQALQRRPITIFGDGYQVRDLLYVEDLVDAMLGVRERLGGARGEVFNVGGGPAYALSLLELVERIEALEGGRPQIRHAATREGDQRYYVSDCGRLAEAIGWSPRTAPARGVRQLRDWLREREPARARAAAARSGAVAS